MIKCKVCGSDFSERAAACPKCGDPNPQATTRFCRACGKPVAQNAVACPGCGCAPMQPGRFCYACASTVDPAAVVCVRCGVSMGATPASVGVPTMPGEPPSKTACAVLAFLVPVGIHRFMMGYPTEGVLQMLLTVFCLVGAFWSWADGIMILSGSLRMKDGRELKA